METPVLNRLRTREVDRRAVAEYGLPSLVLMENAGRGVAERLLLHGPAGPYLICCGKGNNGGDGFVVARHLDNRGWAVRVLLCAEVSDLQGDAKVNFGVLEKTGVPIEVFDREPTSPPWQSLFSSAGCIVDALLGTGASGEPRPPLDEVIEAINAAGVPVLAIDLPSGLDADTGQAARHTVHANQTCTFVAHKPGFFAPGARRFTGDVHVIDIGAPRRLIEELLAEQRAAKINVP